MVRAMDAFPWPATLGPLTSACHPWHVGAQAVALRVMDTGIGPQAPATAPSFFASPDPGGKVALPAGLAFHTGAGQAGAPVLGTRPGSAVSQTLHFLDCRGCMDPHWPQERKDDVDAVTGGCESNCFRASRRAF